ncbi:acyltransferase family protein [uncultured Pseudoteredinibacter sp.]|uniref:acyltransferase family protein n=1 Tax=uncultured Pseudoteredinibacter sp. TaxID=1641701 RepID=UPI002627EDCE|nr:acyltransferase family protein [uncultured Pseudoteredinibacter sp.]
MQADFRPDIQGLRGIAVIAVLINHLNPSLLGGGFFGVDVFFVISGYLISKLLVKSRLQTGNLNLLRFYANRTRRLLPALALMILVTTITYTIFLSPAEQIRHSQGGIFASLWLSNMYFASIDLAYFASDSKNLFLHTWSLAVEEQFYLLWPAVIFLLYSPPNSKQVITSKITWIVFTTTVLAGLVYLYDHDWGFYSVGGRAWQFALGAMAFIYSDKIQELRFSKITPLKFASLAMVVLPMFTHPVTGSELTPAYSILPTLGTGLLLFLGTYNSNNSFLSSRPLQFTGDISYSLYLWHWPIIVLANLYFIELTALQTGGVVIAILLCSSISFYGVERPIRYSQFLSERPSLSLFGALLICITLVSISLASFDFAKKWANDPLQKAISSIRQDLPTLYSHQCDDWYHSDVLKVCSFETRHKKTVMLLGDSTIGQWFDSVRHTARSNEWNLHAITKSSCPIVDQPYYYPRIGRIYSECASWREKALDHLAKNPPELLIIGSSAAAFSKREWIEGTRSVLDRLRKIKKIVILTPPPKLSFDTLECIARTKWQQKLGIPSQLCEEHLKPTHLYSYLSESASIFPNVQVLDINKRICPNGLCRSETDDYVVYRDKVHISNQFALSISEIFEPFLLEQTSN